MKKFKFELEDILKFRKFEQHQAEVELGKALAVEQEIQSNLDNLAQQKYAASEYLQVRWQACQDLFHRYYTTQGQSADWSR